jgi:hypothetical protein
MRKLETELPQWIDHCLSLKTNIGIITEGKEARRIDKELREAAKEAEREAKRLEKTKLREAWLLNSKGYDPPLPPIEHPVPRSQLGAVKMRMMQYAYAFSEEKIQQFVDDFKKIWPETWSDMSAEEITKKCEEIEEVINSRRSDYREKVQ